MPENQEYDVIVIGGGPGKVTYSDLVEISSLMQREGHRDED